MSIQLCKTKSMEVQRQLRFIIKLMADYCLHHRRSMVGRLFQNSNVTFSFRSQYIHSRCAIFIQDVQFSLKSIQDYSFKIQDFDGCINMHNFR